MFNVGDTAVFIRLEDKFKTFQVMSDSDTSSVKSETDFTYKIMTFRGHICQSSIMSLTAIFVPAVSPSELETTWKLETHCGRTLYNNVWWKRFVPFLTDAVLK